METSWLSYNRSTPPPDSAADHFDFSARPIQQVSQRTPIISDAPIACVPASAASISTSQVDTGLYNSATGTEPPLQSVADLLGMPSAPNNLGSSHDFFNSLAARDMSSTPVSPQNSSYSQSAYPTYSSRPQSRLYHKLEPTSSSSASPAQLIANAETSPDLFKGGASGMLLNEIAHMTMAATRPRPSFLPLSFAERSCSGTSTPITPLTGSLLSPHIGSTISTPHTASNLSSPALASPADTSDLFGFSNAKPYYEQQSLESLARDYDTQFDLPPLESEDSLYALTPIEIGLSPQPCGPSQHYGHHHQQQRSTSTSTSTSANTSANTSVSQAAATAAGPSIAAATASSTSTSIPSQPGTHHAAGLKLRSAVITPRPTPRQTPKPSPSRKSQPRQTNVDQMMQYVQALDRAKTPATPPSSNQHSPQESGGAAGPSRGNGKVYKGKDAKGENHSEPKYVCSFPRCGKSFRQRAHLDTHIRAHTGERPFSCPFEGCNKSFSQQCNLRTHMRAHTGERPFACDKCGKAFSQRGNLRNHTLTHLEERPLACRLDGCNKTFNQLGNLKAHHNSAHASTLAAFTTRLQVSSPEGLSTEEKEMFDYFSSIYKNLNRGFLERASPP